jgi:hypothetical protein
MSTQTSLTRVRIYTHMTKSRFLHVEDSLSIGKIRLFAGAYRRSEDSLQQHTATRLAWHFLDIADARIVLAALARAEPDFSYREYKGTPTDNGAVSRVLSVQVKGENVYVELKSGPGKLTPTGAVTPAGKASVEVNVGFKLYEARRMAAAVLAYLHAWDVLQMLEYRAAVGQPGPYLVVPATSDGAENGRRAQAVAAQPTTVGAEQTHQHERASVAAGASPNPPAEPVGDAQPNGHAHPPRKADAVAHARQTAEALFGPDNGRAPQPAPPLQYGDGSPVDEDNSAEVQTFRRFLAEKQAAPASRAALQTYYRQRVTVH